MIYVVFSICLVNLIASAILIYEHFREKKSRKFYFEHGYKEGYDYGYKQGQKIRVEKEHLRDLDDKIDQSINELIKILETKS